MTTQTQAATTGTADAGQQLALIFHETYERLAPQFGYETRADTKAFDPESPNGRLMIAVCTELRAALSATAPAPEPQAASELCQPSGLLFDAFGEPRTRHVRVTLDGAHCVMTSVDGDRYVEDASAAGDESPYVVADVYLSEREFEDLGEFDGF